MYHKYLDRIQNRNVYYEDFHVVRDDRPVVLVSTAALWNHTELIRLLMERKSDWHIVVSQHQCDHVEMYQRFVDEGVTVLIPESCDYDNPERDHGYNPTIQDSLDFARQLYWADVVVNMAGTASLEAMILGTPAVNVRSPGEHANEKEAKKSMAHFGPGCHYADVLPGETTFLAENFQDVPSKIELALQGMDDTRKEKIELMLDDVLSTQSMNATREFTGAAEKVAAMVESVL